MVPKLSVTADKNRNIICGVSSAVNFGLKQGRTRRTKRNCVSFAKNISCSPGIPAWLLNAMNSAAKALNTEEATEHSRLAADVRLIAVFENIESAGVVS